MTKIKICGLTNLEDAQIAAQSGADYLGFIFVPGTPRYINPIKAEKIIKKLSKKVKKVGVFIDSPLKRVMKIARQCKLDYVQLHGKETPAYCGKIKLPVIKSFRVKNCDSIKNIDQYQKHVFALLFDAYHPRKYGGTGKKFNWAILKKPKIKKIYLSGGISLSNFRKAIKQVKPFALDVSSSIEKYPRKKNKTKLIKMIEQVKSL